MNNDLIRTELINMIKCHSISLAINSVGGSHNFKRIMNIKEPIDYLNLFNDMNVVRSSEIGVRENFYYNPQHNIMYYSPISDVVYISFDDVWSFLHNLFNMTSDEIGELTEKWLGNVYNMHGIKTTSFIFEPIFTIE